MPDPLDTLARDLSVKINAELPRILKQLLAEQKLYGEPLQLECTLTRPQQGPGTSAQSLKIASLDITDVVTPSTSQTPISENNLDVVPSVSAPTSPTSRSFRPRPPPPEQSDDEPPAKRRAIGGLRIGSSVSVADVAPSSSSTAVIRRLESDIRVFPQRKKRLPDNPKLLPSSLDKFIGGVWESIFSGVRLDPVEVIEQWQAIESSGQPRLLMDTESEVVSTDDVAVRSMFGRMNILTRKISQTSRTCRSLEVIVQAHWIQAFDDRVTELSATTTKEKAKKTAISEACMDFSWSEKELRNKMAVWRGYHDIKSAGGWAALVFAGMGLYRFCKYRVSFTEETFQTLKALRHRFEVAADCLHPRWRSLLAIVGASTERKYTGHPHDWVVCGPHDDAIPLPVTYHKWDKNFSYQHLDESVIDEEAWGLYDPRTVAPADDPAAHQCQVCGDKQSDDPRENACTCFPNLYGSAKTGAMPVQVFLTPTGKNNGLIACCPFDRGAAIGEFIGQITSGVANKDVMVGQTDRAAYQIWQGQAGNHTRFVNHSCQPNSQFERFVWLGTQRIVLVSKGVEAGEEITVDYSDTYWKVSKHLSHRSIHEPDTDTDH
jgi:hypothetical protein